MAKSFYTVLNREINKSTIPNKSISANAFNFRDSEYSPNTDGFHPVEVRLDKLSGKWKLVYITDFSYQGHTLPELVKEIDICFITKQVFSLFAGGSVRQHAGNLIQLFINNFMLFAPN